MPRITKTNYSGYVYDLEVAGNSNFFANGILIHNCAKKRYILNTWNSEGVHYDTPKISMTGVEAVRSSTPEICKKKFKEAFSIIMNEDEEAIQNFVDRFKEEFKTLRPEEIARTSGVDGIEKYTMADGTPKSGCPMQVRAAVSHNRMLTKLGIERKYDAIQSGEKVKLLHLKMPNPSMSSVIAFQSVLPVEFDVASYIDYNLQFEKVFLQPLKSVTEAIKWDTEKKTDLFAFFN